jgi:hypothetical protein
MSTSGWGKHSTSIPKNIYCLQSKEWLPRDGILNEKKEDTEIIIAWFRKNRKKGCIIDNKARKVFKNKMQIIIKKKVETYSVKKESFPKARVHS